VVAEKSEDKQPRKAKKVKKPPPPYKAAKSRVPAKKAR
jgi:hypothetical protein